jgi:glycosyltransferase involved in cell wall biosynthesis
MKFLKLFLKKSWINLNNVVITFKFYNISSTKDRVKLYFGGAIAGNSGGPKVKVKRLKEFFPSSYIDFNLVYCLSNYPYLSKTSLDRIKKTNIPIILNQNGVFFKGWHGPGWEEKNQELSWAYNSADYIFWQSEFCKISAEHFLGNRSDSGEVLFNAVDTNKFIPSPKSKNSEFTFLVTGKFEKPLFYRLKASIEAFYLCQQKNSDTNLIIAGYMEKDLKYKILDLINALGISKKVKVLGAYSQNNAPEIYNSADAYLMMKYMDASPNVVIEAMACGLPIIYSSTGGVPELVGKEAGIGLFLKESWSLEPHCPKPELISEAMGEMIALRNDMSIAARRRAVAEFNMDNWISKHQKIFIEYTWR